MSRTIKHIVVATDLSKTSERAVELGREMAADKGAKLSVVCSIDPEPYFISDLDPTMLDLTPSLGEELRKVAERGLQRLRDQQLGGSADVTLAVLEGRSPGAAVVEYCEEKQADLIIVGSHGRTGVRRALLGSVAEKIVRSASCDVYVAR